MAITNVSVRKIKKIGNWYYSYTVGTSGSAFILRSPDSANWTDVDFGLDLYNNYNIMGMGGDENSQLLVLRPFSAIQSFEFEIYFSNDNETFTSMGTYLFGGEQFQGVEKINGYFYIITNTNIYKTTDGTDITPISFYDGKLLDGVMGYDSIGNLHRVIFGLGKYNSIDGNNWNFDGQLNYNFYQVINSKYIDEKFLFYYQDQFGAYYLATSTDGMTLDTNVEVGYINDFTIINGMYITVGDYDNDNKTFNTSIDAVNWTPIVSTSLVGFAPPELLTASSDFYYIRFLGDMYRSTDLQTWVLTENSITSIATNTSTSNVVISHYNYEVKYSSNGIDFNLSDLVSLVGYVRCAGPNFFIGVEFESGTIYTSINGGQNFTQKSIPLPSLIDNYFLPELVSYNSLSNPLNNRFGILVYINSVRYYVFTDDFGDTWNILDSEMNLPALASGYSALDNKLVIRGSLNGNYNTIAISDNNVNLWTTIPNPIQQLAYETAQNSWEILEIDTQMFICLVYNNNLTIFRSLTSGNIWEVIFDQVIEEYNDESRRLMFNFNGNLYVIHYHSQSGFDVILSSTDLLTFQSMYLESSDNTQTWSRGVPDSNPNVFIPNRSYGLYANGNLLTINDTNPLQFGVSTDFTNFTTYFRDEGTVYDIKANDSYIFMLFYNPNTTLTEIRRSSNAVDWTTIVADTEGFDYGMEVSNENILIYVYDNSELRARFYDTNGNFINESVVRSNTPDLNVTGFFYVPNTSIWVHTYTDFNIGESYSVYTANLGTNWQPGFTIAAPWLGNPLSKKYRAAVLTGETDTYYISTNGITWSDFPTPEPNVFIYGIDYDPYRGIYIMLVNSNDNFEFKLYRSDNLMDWELVPLPHPDMQFAQDATVYFAGMDRFVIWYDTGSTGSGISMYSTTFFVTYDAFNIIKPIVPTGIVVGTDYQTISSPITGMAVDRINQNVVFLMGDTGGEG